MIRSLFLTPLAALLLTASAVLPLAASAQAPATPLPVEAFFKKPAVSAPVLSPSGKKIAMLVPTETGRMGLAVADVATPDKFKGVAQFSDADVRSIAWVNDGRLVFDAIDFQAGVGDQLGSGLYAVDADGGNFIWLIERTGSYKAPPAARRPLSQRHRFLSTIPGGSDDVLVERRVPGENGLQGISMLVRLNTRSMATKALYADSVPPGAQAWILDRKLQPRVVSTFDARRQEVVYWREEGSLEWKELFRNDVVKDVTATKPVAVDRDGKLYVRALNPDAADGTMALYRYDVKAKKLDGKPIVNLPGYDFEGGILFDAATDQMLGASYIQEAPGMAWFEPSMRQVQDTVDKLLPNTNNYLSCTRCIDAAHMVVTATSDIQSPVYFLFDRQTSKLKLLGQSRPWLPSTAMAGTQDFVRIKARDGMSIPVYVTKPKGKGPFPTVVLVHGGPYVRGNSWGFNPALQFLASRGYLVVEPEFRGSTGYGSKLFTAGWKQWGLGMQDDMTDATKWAIAQGLADPKRIAIAGASYGGYATMMGLVKEPELYKAGINWVGVTDIDLLYTIGWSDMMSADNPWTRFGMPTMIGDPKTDAAQIAATSPLRHANRIKQPVLMAYGEEDLRVPLPHGTKMRDALIASGNKNVEWVQYPTEGHNWMLTKTQVDFWTRVERFLERHVK